MRESLENIVHEGVSENETKNGKGYVTDRYHDIWRYFHMSCQKFWILSWKEWGAIEDFMQGNNQNSNNDETWGLLWGVRRDLNDLQFSVSWAER